MMPAICCSSCAAPASAIATSSRVGRDAGDVGAAAGLMCWWWRWREQVMCRRRRPVDTEKSSSWRYAGTADASVLHTTIEILVYSTIRFEKT